MTPADKVGRDRTVRVETSFIRPSNGWKVLSVVKAGYSRKCMFLRPTLHPSSFLVVGCNGAILVSQVPVMTLLVVYTDE